MEKKTLYFKADNQSLVGQNVPARLASDTVSYIEAVFDLGENWSGFDAVKAVWSTDFDSLCTVLDSSGACVVPHEVLERVGDVWVNLVGSISEDETLTDRLTTYPIKAVVVDANAAVCGSETSPITPSQFDQFVEVVRADADRAEEGATEAAASAYGAAESATSASGSAADASQSASGASQSAQSASESAGSAAQSATSASESAADAEEAKDAILNMTATATTLPEGSQATVDYNNGVMAFGIPRGDTGATGAKGDKGDTGATPNLSIGTVETLAPDDDATATITGTAEAPVLNLGLPKGDTGDVSKAELASLMPLETVSGSVASFSDGSAVFDAEQALVTLEPIQSGSGTPSPDNVRPISGHDSASVVVAGKNVWGGLKMANDIVSAVNNPTSASLGSDSDGDYVSLFASSPISNANMSSGVVFKENTQYTIVLSIKKRSGISASNIGIRYTDGTLGYINLPTGSELSSKTAFAVTSETNKTINHISGILASGESLLYYNECGIFEGVHTVEEFEPYQGESYTTSLGRTVYGGTVDLVSGVLTVERVFYEVTGNESYTIPNQTYIKSDATDAFFIKTDMVVEYQSGNISSNMLQSSERAIWNTEGFPNCIIQNNQQVHLNIANALLGITNPSSETPETAKTKIKNYLKGLYDGGNPLQICYELATPQTYQLTPQAIALLTGDNNVWSPEGQIQVKYRANIGLYVDKKISEVNA